jgi:hypothetical protein
MNKKLLAPALELRHKTSLLREKKRHKHELVLSLGLPVPTASLTGGDGEEFEGDG